MLPATTRPEADVLAGLIPESSPLLLAPSSSGGWFGGEHLACQEPVEIHTGASVGDVAAVLTASLESRRPSCAAALVPYEGPCRVHVYDGGLSSTDGVSWEPWGREPATARPGAFEPPVPVLEGAVASVDATAYMQGVERVRAAIVDGNVYVLNLTYLLEGRAASRHPGELFASMHWRFGAEMSAVLAWPEGGVVSVSPERFLSLARTPDGWSAMVSPIKGTRPRGLSPEEDVRLVEELRSSAKERAEHVMIVDLERNDLGIVCVPGTVAVTRLFDIVPTPYCHQMVSDVTGLLREDVGLAEVLSATFPCGSVTGAPKRAAMHIIGELEAGPRGAYTGALIVARPGRLDSSVLIRTLEIGPGGSAKWGTGCGITIDSDPAEEWAESLLKARPATT
ncbi:MAG: anthranilate synthase component I family protein [Actinomycetota bacterium]|nr:anthranilate synthase component I family protein [Actinomycetota bacterium]